MRARRTDPRWLPLCAALLALVHLGGVVHLATARHGVCWEHGVVVDLDAAPRGGEAVDQGSDSVFSGWSSSNASVANSSMTLNDPTCVSCEYGRANNLVAQRLEGNFSYDVPGNWGEVPKAISRGWQMLGIATAQTGSPFTVISPEKS